MYPPFEFNNLLGPLMALGCFSGAAFMVMVLGALQAYFNAEEAGFRKSRQSQQSN